MSIAIVTLFVLNIIGFLVLAIVWAKLKRPPQEDPRLSRGLQLLQSKIAIIESLSDKTENQFKDMSQLIDKKMEKLQKANQILRSDTLRLEETMEKCQDLVEIFQDKIPHDEVIQRKNSIQLITAARMANSGASIDEIVERVQLPRAQVEFISKVNKDNLIFSEENLPDWVNKFEKKEEELSSIYSELSSTTELNKSLSPNNDIQNFVEDTESWVSETPRPPVEKEEIGFEGVDKIKEMGASFRELCQQYEDKQKKLDEEIENNITKKVIENAEKISTKFASEAGRAFDKSKDGIKTLAEKQKVRIQKVKFPTIDIDLK